MSGRSNKFTSFSLEPAETILRCALHSWNHPEDRPVIPLPARAFVTVSRQPGAGAITFSHRLAERLNSDKEVTGEQADWSAWDRELVQKVSEETGVAKEIIEMMPNRRNTWMDDLLQILFEGPNPADVAELHAYKQMILTVRALATAGHAIIVGQGGLFITQGIPAAIHLRLVAPLAHRISYTAEREKISHQQAVELVAESDRKRAEFYHRYWPRHVIAPEIFTMTLNSAELTLDELVESVLPVIRDPEIASEHPTGSFAKEVARVNETMHA
jgi:cytidylate kinase